MPLARQALTVLCFHPSKEGFKADYVYDAPEDQYYVSIPLRKVSRDTAKATLQELSAVSIPLRKVSRDPVYLYQYFQRWSFHPSKEGFKGPARPRRGPRLS